MISRRQFLRWFGAAGVVGAAAAAYGTVIEPLMRLKIARYELAPPRWPAGFDLTIAAIADVHACRPWMSPGRIRSIVETTNALGADMIVLLGDYVASHRFVTGDVAADEWAAELARLKAPLGVHAILGNHEWWADQAVQRTGSGPTFGQRALEAVGIPVYENRAMRLTKNGRPFWIAGLSDQLAFVPSWHKHAGRRVGADDLAGTLAQVTDDAPIVLMAHEPDIAVKVPERVSLTLSGHTHGGQVRLLGWSLVVPSRYGNRFAYGHVREKCDVIVSGGLGCSITPLRFGVPPEIVLVRLGGRANA